MRLNKIVTLALLASAAPAAAQYGAPAPPRQMNIPQPTQPQQADEGSASANDANAKPSKKAVKALIALQNAVNANDNAAYPAALAAAEAAAASKEDMYLIGRLQLKKAVADKDAAAMASAVGKVEQSGILDNATLAGLWAGVGSNLYTAKQYDQASTAFEKAMTLNPNDFQNMASLGEIRFAQGRKADALPLIQKAISTQLAAGQKPTEAFYRRAFEVAYEIDSPAAVDLARQWASAYPNPNSWRMALAIYQNNNKSDVEAALGILRLMRATGSLSDPADYSLYATAASDQGNYVEAQAIIDEGLAKKAFDPSQRIFKEIIGGLKAKQIATAADLETATKETSKGAGFLRIGDRYYGLGQYAKAAELYRMALGKGDADANVVNFHLGMALARSGDKAGAEAAFAAVQGKMKPIAAYWTMYIKQMA
jgi:tetratricopeptide (TPR) repeat protein